jgi:uncharacterized protein with HEPN domain
VPSPVQFPAFLKSTHPELLIMRIFPDITEVIKFSSSKLFSALYSELLLLLPAIKLRLVAIIGEKAKRIPKVIKRKGFQK